MLKVMIVDDERIVRQGLRKTIPWEEMGTSVCGEGEDVSGAIAVARKTFPDIVICDIRLPGGEGFDVVDAVQNAIPWVQFIMLTAYSDQKYMRKAIYNGVCDYLIKPAKKEDIKEAVERAKAKVFEYHKKIEHETAYEQFIADNMEVLRENFLSGLLIEGHSEDKLLQDAKSMHIHVEGPMYRLLVIEHMENYHRDLSLLMQEIAFSLQEYSPELVLLENKDVKIIAILNCEPDITEKIIRSKIQDLHLRQIFISDISSKLSELYHGYEKNNWNHNRKDRASEKDLEQAKEMLYDAVKYHDSEEELYRLFHSYLMIAEAAGISEDELFYESHQIMETIRILTGAKKSMDRDSGAYTELPLLEEFQSLCNEIKNSARYKLDDAAGKALYFIRKKYKENISLEQISAELFMSSSYLSRILKDRTGHGFSHWLNIYRVDAAKILLQDKSCELSMEEVATACGYSSYRIFSENFKKYEGVTATEYKEQR